MLLGRLILGDLEFSLRVIGETLERLLGDTEGFLEAKGERVI